MDPFRRLEEIFAKFPGIGPRQAKRFVYYLVNKSPSSISEFVKLVEEVKKSSIECGLCHRVFLLSQSADSFRNTYSNFSSTQPNSLPNKHSPSRNNTSGGYPLCSICSDPQRDHSTIMIVARDSDFETIEKSGAYNGLYFILGGTIPILDKEPDKRIRLELLLKRLAISDIAKPTSKPLLAEIILSLNTTPDGENTALIVKDAIQRIVGNDVSTPSTSSVKITVLGRGLSTGAELEYADGETIKNALKNRG
jgi:recombination protein RecR